MVKSAAGSATYLAGLTDELFQYYVNFAKGGVEMIWVEGEVIEGGVISDELKAFGKKLSDEVKKYGSHLGYQGAHGRRPVYAVGRRHPENRRRRRRHRPGP
ncbi:MAG: hypothetical protein ACLUCU_03810 [Slackia sp.]